jgi:hypothetical protein
VQPAAPAAAPVPVAEEKPRRTRKAKEAAPAAPPAAGTETPAADDAVEPLVLFVNCTPTRSPFVDLTGYVNELASELAQKCSLPDVRTASEGACAFGKWGGLLSAMAKDNPPTGQCVIWRGDLADPVIEALAGIASEVVRGR